jgi:hypothetical protein
MNHGMIFGMFALLGQKYCLVFKIVEHFGVFLMNESWHDLWDVCIGCDCRALKVKF